MKFTDIEHMNLINEVESSKVNEIAQSIRKNGWVGCPILILNDELLSGSHRLAALQKLADEDYDLVMDLGDIAEDVTDIVNDNMSKYEDKHGWCPDIDYGDIGWLLQNSWVEEYKDEIAEW